MKIIIIGVGGCGRNSLNNLVDLGIYPECTVYVDTDTNSLPASKCHTNLTIGESLVGKIGTGANQELGRAAAELSKAEIEKMLEGADFVLIIAGLGAGVGSGATPFIAELVPKTAKLFAVVTTPADYEPKKRKDLANETLLRLYDVIGEENVRVVRQASDVTYHITATIERADRAVTEAAKDILDTIAQ